MKHNSEIVGILSTIKTVVDKHKLIFTMMKIIEIPRSAIPTEKLQELRGARIGVSKIDGAYRFRRISK